MQLSQFAAPSSPLVSLPDAKAHLRVEHDAENDYLTALAATAEAMVAGRDGWTGRALVTQTWALSLPGFPLDDCIRLPLPPLQSVVHVKYYDSANDQQTFDASNYAVLTADTPGRLELKPTVGWPGTYQRPDAVEIRFTAGYGNAADVPAPIKQAALIALASLYANRGDDEPLPIPAAVRRLLSPYKVWSFGNDWG